MEHKIKCLMTFVVTFVVIYVIMMLIRPSFLMKKVGEKSVFDMPKGILYSLVISLVVVLVMSMFKGKKKSGLLYGCDM